MLYETSLNIVFPVNFFSICTILVRKLHKYMVSVQPVKYMLGMLLT